ncbi:BON domain-containing protein [Paraburkholderia acidisoli]|uniref:BON domain-containing protein n=1 Tax=Paraburkholderia acidisoli TaxID=2571748 RepID=A0A7Z2GEL1_9BURK|nr:BON domain-containing protein [Paraburkholderia acidisoli]QGZ60348.1 BON domain-containing protein [Paraburkholderia acidisoli]
MSRYGMTRALARTTLTIGFAASLCASLQGCFLALAGAAGGTALVATDRRTVGSQTEDREIQVKAIADLNKNLPDASHVNVAVFNQRVLLTGEVPDEASKQKAEGVVRAVTNVESIVNGLSVSPASSFSDRANDSYLEARVKSELIAYKDISANNFKVVSEGGTVYLMGLVTQREGDIAADATSKVMGVAKVVKCYQYIKPEQAAVANAAASNAPAATPAPSADEPTVGAVPDSGVSSRPIEHQPPAPVTNSTATRAGNGGAAL